MAERHLQQKKGTNQIKCPDCGRYRYYFRCELSPRRWKLWLYRNEWRRWDGEWNLFLGPLWITRAGEF